MAQLLNLRGIKKSRKTYQDLFGSQEQIYNKMEKMTMNVRFRADGSSLHLRTTLVFSQALNCSMLSVLFLILIRGNDLY